MKTIASPFVTVLAILLSVSSMCYVFGAAAISVFPVNAFLSYNIHFSRLLIGVVTCSVLLLMLSFITICIATIVDVHNHNR